MFDPVTREFLASAPSLPGLPAERFADELTSAYVEIAAARLALGEAKGTARDNLPRLSDQMARIADVLEAQVILGLAGERTRAAAFVAASARQVVFRVSELLTGYRQTRVDEDAISADIAAALLFLIAERTADAYEASHLISEPAPPQVRQLLALSIRNLTRGRLARIADLELEQYRPQPTQLSITDATDLLYFRILEGLVLVAKDCTGRPVENPDEAQFIFQQVRDLAVDFQPEEQIPGVGRKAGVSSIIPGPHHLAGLLERAAGIFQRAAIVRLPAPKGVSEARWREWLLSEAERRPFLWENHQRAVATSYLDVGCSLVMTSPTGSGKTTLAMLKIASTICAGRSVCYLAPTHALVGQIEHDLNARMSSLVTAANIDDVLLEEIGQQLPELAVLTPERCFAMLSFAPELFRRVGLLIFDECHLMGVARGSAATFSFDRRSIDAMLCLLSFAASNKDADYLLLSAMISNGDDIAAWLQGLTGRPCISFDDKWKPTRQLKACVVYEAQDLARVKRNLADDFAQRLSLPKSIPAAVKAMARGVPIGLFSTAMGWHPANSETLAFRRLAATPLPLGVARHAYGWRLTANRNEVAAQLAALFAASGLKTIVFCESAPTAESVANRVNGSDLLVSPKGRLDNVQSAWRKKALEEVGSEAALYDAGTAMPAAVHHGELLSEERWLVESLFKDRQHGLNVLAATSTLAQGLNLPCDVVILAGTDRLDDSDPEEKRRSDLLPHEILNALGRAGRAGLAANGLAVVIPADPISCSTEAKSLPESQLLPIMFSESDQCLPLTDPIASLYDHIVVYGVAQDEASYLMKRLALSLGTIRDGVETFDDFTRRSFGFFLKWREDPFGAEEWVAQRRHKLERLIEAARGVGTRDWIAELAAKSGASLTFISNLAEAFETAPLTSPDACDWITWLLNQLPIQEQDFDTFLRPDVVGRILGRAYTRSMGVVNRRERARQAIVSVLPGWFSAQPLTIIERTLVDFIRIHEGRVKRPTSLHPKAKHARRFALRLAPDLSYLAGVFGQVVRKLAEDDRPERIPLAITQSLPQLVRRGFNTPYHLYLDRRAPGLSRQEIQQQFEAISPLLERDPSDDWATVRRKLKITEAQGIFDSDPDTMLDEV